MIFGKVSSLLSGLFELSKDVPLAAGEAFRERLTQLHDQCFLGIDEEGEFVGKRWCTVGEVLLFKSIGLLFPSTDFRHPVVTPGKSSERERALRNGAL